MKTQSKKDKVLLGVYLKFDDGETVNLQDLSQEDYEDFLDTFNKLRLAYFATLSGR